MLKNGIQQNIPFNNTYLLCKFNKQKGIGYCIINLLNQIIT